MLRRLIQEKRVSFHPGFHDWKEAIRASCRPLEETGAVDSTYAEQIIRCVEEYGPYIVLAPGVCMPHSQENAEGVRETAVALMIIEEPVAFDPTDREKDATIFFTIASKDHEQHIENLMILSEMLTNEALIEALSQAHSQEALAAVAEKYNL